MTIARAQRASYIAAVKIALLMVYLAGGYGGVIARFDSIESAQGQLVFIFVWLLAVISVFLVAFTPRWPLRLLWVFALVLPGFFVDVYQQVTDTYMQLSDWELMLNSASGYTLSAIVFYSDVLAYRTPLAIAGVVGFLLPNRLFFTKLNRPIVLFTSLLLPCVTALIVAAIVYHRGGFGANGFPRSYIALPFTMVISYDNWSRPKYQPRAAVSINASSDYTVKDIVFIMDESIRPDFLHVNNPLGVPVLSNFSPDSYFNFGIIASATNCSAGSNAIVRYGARKSHFRRDIQERPSFWHYAKAAGFKTVYIDAQQSNGKLQNMMTDEEKQQVDVFLQIDNTNHYQRDIEAASAIRDWVSKPEPHFIFVNKLGAHFPFEGKYPRSHDTYTPSMSAHQSVDEEIDYRAIEGFGGKKFINSYKNAVSWSVGEFWAQLSMADYSDKLFIYTSDHGQNFEQSDTRVATHCNSETPAAEEGRVPLIFFTTNPRLSKELNNAVRKNHNKGSHFNLFATMLIAMGFDASDVLQQGYEPSFFDALDEEQAFTSNFFVRFGRAPLWHGVQ
jgi:glucan phosphoethanolaminetransferase (alkaline phosphatase superfamily)